VALPVRLSLAKIACLGAVLLPACKSEVAIEHPARVVPPGHAELPAVPDLSPVQSPERYPDGAFSIRGLQAADKKTLAPEVQLRGTVATLHPCPLVEKICKPAPFLYLTDAKTGQGKRLLVGGERDLEARGWKQGQEVTLTGQFAMGSEDGTWFAPQGMLLLSPLPPPADANATPDAR
jgi:hypothetical protein